LFLDLPPGAARRSPVQGFEGAARARYKHPKKGDVQVEIYAMKDAGAAFGIYSFNSRTKGNPVQIGDEALLTDYYLLVGKGGPGERCLIDENGRFLLLARDGDCNLTAIGADEAALHGLLQQALAAHVFCSRSRHSTTK
jgi:hypothetical protein